ncbi:MAG: hypothetical protein ABJ015_08730, partial [Rhodopirellula bahusiensis]
MAKNKNDSQAEDWLQEEWKEIDRRRKTAFGKDDQARDRDQPPSDLVGLTLSGGGIRSALYNDGFLQGLSHRGFLRYVDYLSSVSGGGYIAGHLVSLAKTHDKETSNQSTSSQPAGEKATKQQDPASQAAFHDDAERWQLGRDPKSGQVVEGRLAGVGGYLSRPFELLPAYLISCFFSAAFYIGITGIIATLLALLWRTFDAPIFRDIYLKLLSIRFGDELLIAFIPAIACLLLLVIADFIFWSCRRVPKWRGECCRLGHMRFRRISLATVALTCLTSLAIFLGNGTTNVHGNASGALLLNKYAQWLAVIAGTLQLLVFFGSDRLFRSERAEAKGWQRHTQKMLTVVVMLFAVFAFVHWMGREDISNFTRNRDPHLEIGDVQDWQVAKRIFEPPTKEEHWAIWFGQEVASVMFPLASYESRDSVSFDSHLLDAMRLSDTDDGLTISKLADAKLQPESQWARTLSGRRWELSSIDPAELNPRFQSNDQSQKERESLLILHRAWIASHAYVLSQWFGDDPTLASSDSEDDEDSAWLKGPQSLYRKVRHRRHQQWTTLQEWNKDLESLALTERLVETIVNAEKKTGMSLVNQIRETKDFNKHLRELSDTQKKKLLTYADNGFDTLDSSRESRQQLASLNRSLLELAYPSAIRQMDVPSTFVVPPHDQRARKSWLLFWIGLALAGSLRELFVRRNASVFDFYRRQIGSNFLCGEQGARVQLGNLDPTADGLPYPLLLASSMKPVTTNECYRVEAKPFVFTPKRSGDFGDKQNRFDSAQVSLSKFLNRRMTLGDAVTLSGAAVSPLMTTNRMLSILVDFSRTDLGGQVYRKESVPTDENESRFGLTFGCVIATLAFAILIWMLCGRYWWSLALLLGASISTCTVMQIGIPHFLRSILLPRENRTNRQEQENHDGVGPGDSRNAGRSSTSFYVADGGFCDYLGVSELLRRNCKLIVVSDAGANLGDNKLGTLANMCEKMTAEHGVRFLDLDHESPIDFGRLELDEKRLVHQPYVCFRYRYRDGSEGLMIYCQMAISDQDPIEIQQIRQRFPKFPDEPTVNQFYTDEQVSAYRLLGYHIANRMCRELERWDCRELSMEHKLETDPQPTPRESGESVADRDPNTNGSKRKLNDFVQALHSSGKPCPGHKGHPPHFDVFEERLLTAYRLACYEEISYREDDIYCEAVWPVTKIAFPQLRKRTLDWMSHGRCTRPAFKLDQDQRAASDWLAVYEQSADIRSAYRKAVLEDVNLMQLNTSSFCAALWRFLEDQRQAKERDLEKLDSAATPFDSQNSFVTDRELLESHLVAMATACQEIHRGRPHAAFQIGGRKKLVELCCRIAWVIDKSLSEESRDTFVKSIDSRLDSVTAELMEMERSVFQGGEHVTTVSFIQCMTLFWGWRQADQVARYEDASELNDRAKKAREVAFKDSLRGRGRLAESSIVEVRRDVDRGLKHVRLGQVINAMKCLWWIGYASGETQASTNSSPQTKNDQAGASETATIVLDWVAQWSNDKSSSECVITWIKTLRSNPALAALYENCVHVDACRLASMGIPKVFRIWQDFNGFRESTSPRVERDFLASHLVGILLACRGITETACQELDANDRKSLQQNSVELAKLFMEFRNAEPPFESTLRTDLVRLVQSCRKFDRDISHATREQF